MISAPFRTLAAALPEDDAIRKTAAEVLAREEYRPEALPAEKSLVGVILREVVEWILAPFRWIYQNTEGMPEPIRWIIVAIVTLALLAILWHMIDTLVRSSRLPQRAIDAGRRQRQHASQTPEELERLADDAAAREDFIHGVRLLFRAMLLRLANVDKRPIRPGTTNRELLRRYRETPVRGVLTQFVDTIDEKWYGDRPCTSVDFANCRAAHASFVEMARRAVAPAQSAAVSASAVMAPETSTSPIDARSS